MDKDEYLEEENYSMNALADYVGESVFSYRDIRDYVFDITVTPWSKLYKREFIEENKIRFPKDLYLMTMCFSMMFFLQLKKSHF